MANNNQEPFKYSTVRMVAIAIVAVFTVINFYSIFGTGGPKTTEDYIAIFLNLACIFMCGVIIRNERKRKAEYEEAERQKIEKRQRRRNNKKK